MPRLTLGVNSRLSKDYKFTNMYAPKFTITNSILKNVGLVEAAREVIINAPIVPSYEKKFREEAIARQVHYGTHLEGNDLLYPEAIKVVAEMSARNITSANQVIGVVGQEKDIQEVVNYRRVMDYISQLYSQNNSEFIYTEAILNQIHLVSVDKLVSPEHAGRYRVEQVTVRNTQTGEIFFRPPPAVEVPFLVKDVIDWLNSAPNRELHPVLRAGIIHYDLAAIHPYVEANGRTARAFATLVLLVEGYDIKRLFALEEYFDRQAAEYYGAIASVSNQSSDLLERDLTPWLDFFTKALAVELSRVKEKVRTLSADSRLVRHLGGRQIELSERQLKLMEYIQSQREITMATAKNILSMVSEDTILRDLKDLANKGVISKHGVTKAAKYVLSAS